MLCFGITPDDHDWLQRTRAPTSSTCADYLHEHEIACALAHPFYAVEAPLTPRHRRRLAELFPVWEVRNGSRAPELNAPAAVYIETHGGIGVGGSDDHAGVDIGRTYTRDAGRRDADEFLAHLRAGRVAADGKQGSAAKWAHGAIALAVRALGSDGARGAPDPARRPADVPSGSCPRATRAGRDRPPASGPEDGAGCCARGSTRSASSPTRPA